MRGCVFPYSPGGVTGERGEKRGEDKREEEEKIGEGKNKYKKSLRKWMDGKERAR